MRTPPLYPDAVTLAPGLRAADVLRHVEPGAGCSVKDSFADLDLGPHGLAVLFEAEWIHLVHAPPARSEWHRVRSVAELADWTAAWGEQPPGFFPDVLLGDPSVRFLRTSGGGAIANRSADVIGLSNLFGVASWSEAAAAAQAELGAVPVVGYASGPDLVAAHLAGFESDGPLRVWIDH